MNNQNIEQLMEEVAGGWSGEPCSAQTRTSWRWSSGWPQSERWTAFNLFYHEDRGRLLARWLRPLWAQLWQSRLLSRFFFTQDDLGGPHIRVRVLLTDTADANSVATMIRSSANAFFQRQPSVSSVPREEIWRRSQQLAARDPWESMTEPLPDNRCVETHFQPEAERYGGQELLPASLDAFTATSILALDYTESTGAMSWRQRLPICFRILTHLALGLARSRDEWLVIHRYIERWWAGSPLAKLFTTADAAFERQATTLVQLMHSDITEIAGSLDDSERALGNTMDAFVIGRRLALDVAGTSADRWRTIVETQMHRTANRLGLTNPNEVYVGRLLLRSARQLAKSSPPPSSVWSWAEAPRGEEIIEALADARLCNPVGEEHQGAEPPAT